MAGWLQAQVLSRWVTGSGGDTHTPLQEPTPSHPKPNSPEMPGISSTGYLAKSCPLRRALSGPIIPIMSFINYWGVLQVWRFLCRSLWWKERRKEGEGEPEGRRNWSPHSAWPLLLRLHSQCQYLAPKVVTEKNENTEKWGSLNIECVLSQGPCRSFASPTLIYLWETVQWWAGDGVQGLQGALSSLDPTSRNLQTIRTGGG